MDEMPEGFFTLVLDALGGGPLAVLVIVLGYLLHRAHARIDLLQDRAQENDREIGKALHEMASTLNRLDRS